MSACLQLVRRLISTQRASLLLVAPLLATLTACVDEPPPTISSVPIRAFDWEGVTPKEICLTVEEGDPENDTATSIWSNRIRYVSSTAWLKDGFSKSYATRVRWLLESLGMTVMDDTVATNCDTELRMILGVHGLHAQYENQGVCWSGAQLYGRLILTAPGREPLISNFAEQREVPPTIVPGVTECSPNADLVGLTPLLDQLASWWGPDIYLEALRFPSSPSSKFWREINISAAQALGYISLSDDQRSRLQYYQDHSMESWFRKSLTRCGERIACGPIEEYDLLVKIAANSTGIISGDSLRCSDQTALREDWYAFKFAGAAQGCIGMVVLAASLPSQSWEIIPTLIDLIEQGIDDRDFASDNDERDVALLAAFALKRITGKDYLVDVISWKRWWQKNKDRKSSSSNSLSD